MTSTKNLLVIGDAMIDRAWVVAAGAETSQAHGDVAPQKVIDPSLAGVRPGGAALTAAFLATHTGSKVRLLAPYGKELERLLDTAKVELLPEFEAPDRQDTIKFRIYADRGNNARPMLTHRFDLDIGAGALTIPKNISAADFVVVADFQKGVVTEAHLKELVPQFKNAKWFVDSKNAKIVTYKLWDALDDGPTLFVNREEFAAMLSASVPNPHGHIRNFAGPWHHVESLILDAAEDFHQKFPEWDLVVKLDVDGAAAFWSDRKAWKFSLAQAPAVQTAAGIGAGDAFIAGWTERATTDDSKESRLEHASRRAWAWVKASEFQPDPAPWPDAKWPGPATLDLTPAEGVDARKDKKDKAHSLKGLKERGVIALSEAGGHCGKFMTMNARTGALVRAFASEIRAYFRAPGGRHPLNCMVWAQPGSGKSFLVKQVAKSIGANFTEINVAATTSFEDLKTQLAALHSADEDLQLVMIDEFMAPVEKSEVFPALLVPLWHQTRTKKFAFVLVDSYPKVNSVEELSKNLAGRDGKGPDLVSRINGPQMSLPAPDEVDRAVLVASLLRRNHPQSAFSIDYGALDALAGEPLTGTWSPRAVEYVIEALTPTANVVRLKDLEKIGELCTRMRINLKQDGVDKSVKIVD